MLAMPPVISRPAATAIVTQLSLLKSKRRRENKDELPRGCTGRNTVGKKKKRKIVLENNAYYEKIMERISEIEKEERTGKNRFVNIDNLYNASDGLLCKKYTVDEIQNERRRTVEILANHLANKKSKTIPCKEELICEFTSLLIKNGSRRTNSILQGTKVTTNNKTVGIGSQTSFCCAHGHNFQLSPNLTHPDSKGLTLM